MGAYVKLEPDDRAPGGRSRARSDGTWDRNGVSNVTLNKLRDASMKMSDAYLAYVNQVIDAVGGQIDLRSFAANNSAGASEPRRDRLPRPSLPGDAEDAGGDKYHSNDPEKIVAAAVEYELQYLNFFGGDLDGVAGPAVLAYRHGRRAPPSPRRSCSSCPSAAGPATPSWTIPRRLLSADIQIAQDYRFYLDNAETINFLMAQAPGKRLHDRLAGDPVARCRDERGAQSRLSQLAGRRQAGTRRPAKIFSAGWRRPDLRQWRRRPAQELWRRRQRQRRRAALTSWAAAAATLVGGPGPRRHRRRLAATTSSWRRGPPPTMLRRAASGVISCTVTREKRHRLWRRGRRSVVWLATRKRGCAVRRHLSRPAVLARTATTASTARRGADLLNGKGERRSGVLRRRGGGDRRLLANPANNTGDAAGDTCTP